MDKELVTLDPSIYIDIDIDRGGQFREILKRIGLEGKLQPVNNKIGLAEFSLYPKIFYWELPGYLGDLNGFQAKLMNDSNPNLADLRAQIGSRSYLKAGTDLVTVLGDYSQIFPWIEQLGNKIKKGENPNILRSNEEVWFNTQIDSVPFMLFSKTHWLGRAMKSVNKKYKVTGSNESTPTFVPSIRNEKAVLAIEDNNSNQTAYMILRLDQSARLELIGEKKLIVPIVEILNRHSMGRYKRGLIKQFKETGGDGSLLKLLK